MVAGPVPFESNPVPHPEYFQPSTFDISAITRGYPTALVTTTEAHNYVVGQLVRFHIPLGWGMRQLDGQQAYVTAVNSSTSFTIDLPTRSFDAFTTPSPAFQTAQVSAIGDENQGWTFNGTSYSRTQLAPPGAFLNISPAPN